MEILKLNAPCKDYIWGGNRLREEYGKVSDADKIAESWELSCHKDGQSVIANGKDKGKTLSEYVAENKNALGTACGRFEYFPILIKLIDARITCLYRYTPTTIMLCVSRASTARRKCGISLTVRKAHSLSTALIKKFQEKNLRTE